MPRFAHVAFSCEDMGSIEQFYTKHFGFRRVRVVPLEGDQQVVFVRSGALTLELFQAEGKRPALPTLGDGPHYPGLRHLAFQVDDIEATLQALGSDARVTLGPLAFDDVIPGWRTVWVADPEDNVIEISQGFRDDETLVAGA
jgi:glyoxylase I family protein